MKDLTFHVMTDEDVNRQDSFNTQNEYDDNQCQCKGSQGFTLEIDCGSVYVTHTQCGKQPWFMHDDFHEYVHMETITVKVAEETGCRDGCGSHPDKMGCDCGPEITLTPDAEGSR